MKIFALVSCFFYLLSSIDSASLQNSKQDEWTLFKLRHGKSYKTQVEDNLRRIVFLDNQRRITEHNELYKKGEVSYKLGMNEFGDLLDYEFNEYMKGYNASLKKDGIARGHAITYLQPYNVIVPKNFDWRKKGAVTGVKNQKQCGSCWAFSATGSLEGQHFRKTGKLVSLSEQNLIDCSTKYGNAGCDGGNMDHSFLYVKDNHGLDTEASYPYEAANDKCRFNESNVGATDQGYVDLPRGDEQTLQLVVATIGPISVAIDASSYHFQFYKEGVYYNEKCDNDVGLLDHAVLAVGYGTEDGQDYWLVKNSWGTTWGMDGYVKMSRNRDNNCGIATAASYPLI